MVDVDFCFRLSIHAFVFEIGLTGRTWERNHVILDDRLERFAAAAAVLWVNWGSCDGRGFILFKSGSRIFSRRKWITRWWLEISSFAYLESGLQHSHCTTLDFWERRDRVDFWECKDWNFGQVIQVEMKKDEGSIDWGGEGASRNLDRLPQEWEALN